MKWSNKTGHLVKDVKCHNEVNYDKTKTRLSRGLQARCRGAGDQLYRTRQAAIADVREYVAVYYNSKCQHSTLGYRTPMDYEKDLNKVSGIC
jgi:hypothetical protein